MGSSRGSKGSGRMRNVALTVGAAALLFFYLSSSSTADESTADGNLQEIQGEQKEFIDINSPSASPSVSPTNPIPTPKPTEAPKSNPPTPNPTPDPTPNPTEAEKQPEETPKPTEAEKKPEEAPKPDETTPNIDDLNEPDNRGIPDLPANLQIPVDALTPDSYKFDQDTIVKLVKQLKVMVGKLLIYNPSDEQMMVYTVTPNATANHRDVCPRCPDTLRVLLNSIKKVRPQRFQKDQPPFQLFFSDRDFPFTKCDPLDCYSHPSWLHFGSFYRNRSLLKYLKPVPNFHYLGCIAEIQLNETAFGPTDLCTTWSRSMIWGNGTAAEFHALDPKIPWRGSDYHLLPQVMPKYFVGNWSVPYYDFRPRRYAIKELRHDNTDWLNINFGSNSGRKRYNRMEKEDFVKFKYHIDFGGTSGTTWTGTLEKMAMPGMLFHHDTLAGDWYFDRMKPWEHYVPIRTDVSDLKEKFQWAESHPEDAARIAKAGTEFARYMLLKSTIKEDLDRYFGEDPLGLIVDGYQPAFNESFQSILDDYTSKDVFYTEVSHCTPERCFSKTKPRFTFSYSLTNRSDCNVPKCPFRRELEYSDKSLDEEAAPR